MKQLKESILTDKFQGPDLFITSRKYPWLNWKIMQSYTFVDDLKLINGDIVKEPIIRVLEDAGQKIKAYIEYADLNDASRHLIGQYNNAIASINEAIGCAKSFGTSRPRQSEIISWRPKYERMCEILNLFFCRPKIANILSKQGDRGPISLFMKGSNIDEKQLMIIIDEKLTRERDILFEECQEVSERNKIPVELHTDTDNSYFIIIKLDEVL